ncbi:hypothetical protein RDI58_024076 [Solanum bulbocastanum]|uniref:Uncharacterized protein n=1 Tax=Solanum bulbocastanum TaxID=147425 RepID=A0AAN8SXJ9_SOLBU
MTKGWGVSIHGCKMMQVVKKLKQLKKSLRRLNSQQFGNIVQETNKSREMLKQAQQQLQEQPMNMELQRIEKEIYTQFKHISYLAELYLQKQSKMTWLKLGDDYTRYFFSIIKHRRLKLATTQLRDENGQWRTDPKKMQKYLLTTTSNS